MGSLLALSIPTAVLCGFWTFLASAVHLIGWAGFAGCTTFFSVGTGDRNALIKTLICNFVGVLCGFSILSLTKYLSFAQAAAIYSGIISFVMCMLGKFHFTSFIPGIFMGCFSTFACNGHYGLLILSMICGAFLGLACNKSGAWLYSVTNKHKSEKTVQNVQTSQNL